MANMADATRAGLVQGELCGGGSLGQWTSVEKDAHVERSSNDIRSNLTE